MYGTTDGMRRVADSTGGRSYCPRRKTISNGSVDTAICNADWYVDSFFENVSCPKGWGKSNRRYPDDYYSVKFAQGYINDRSTPIYSTITKYRDAYHNYITTRVAKA